MKVYIIGIGVNGGDSLTKEAESAIAEAQLLIGAERMLLPFRKYKKDSFCSYIPQEIADKLSSCGLSCAAVLMSGDCGFFSGTKKLLPLLEKHDVTFVWVKGHAGHPENERCDRLAVEQRDKYSYK